jgi:hypothetical protein
MWKIEPLLGSTPRRCVLVHLNDLLGDRETETGCAFGPRNRAVDLLELLEVPCLTTGGNAGTGVGHTDFEVLLHALAMTHTSPVSVNLMALPTRLSRTRVKRCSSPTQIERDLGTSVVSVSFLFWASDVMSPYNSTFHCDQAHDLFARRCLLWSNEASSAAMRIHHAYRVEG